MDRRRYLSIAAGALAGLAGCGSGPSSTATPPTTSQPTTTTETEAGLAAAIETSEYLVRSFAQDPERRVIEPDDIVPLGDISDPLRSALEAALEGGYSTDEVGNDLLAEIDEFRVRGGDPSLEPYFSVNGTPYAFDPTVPYFVAELDMDVEDADPELTVTYDDLDDLAEPADRFVRTLGAYGTMVARSEYRVSVVPSSVEELLERYDYVRDPSGVGRIVTERVDPGPPYTISARELTASDIWGRPVHRAASLPDELRSFVEVVVASDRRTLVYPASQSEYRSDDLPAGYDEHLGSTQHPPSGPLVELDGTVYEIEARAIRREHVPLSVSVTPTGPDAFELTVAPSEAGEKPAIDGPVDLEATWSVPGPLWILDGDDRHRLDRVETVIRGPSGDVATPTGDEETASVRPDEALAATYRVPAEVPPGTYRAWGLVRVSWVSASGRPSPTWPFPFQVVVSVPEA